MERRVKLTKEKQRELFIKLSNKFGNLRLVSEKFAIPYSTIKKYACCSLFLPVSLFLRVIGELKLDKNNLDFEYLDSNWGARLGGKRGMEMLEKKYPDKIKIWRKFSTKKSAASRLKKIHIPEINEKFSEFIGAYLGDGTLTKYFIRISGDYRYDIPYFDYLNSISLELFGIKGMIYKDKIHHTMNLTFFSKTLCDYFVEKLQLKIGDKIRNNNIIPETIIQNKDLSLACLRGLVDTDGCVSRRGRNGEQFTITFFSANKHLINQIDHLSKKYGLFTFISKDFTTIGTNSHDKIINYFKLVGSSNLRHLVRFYQRFFFNEKIYQYEVNKYYQQDLYRNIIMPFKLTS